MNSQLTGWRLFARRIAVIVAVVLVVVAFLPMTLWDAAVATSDGFDRSNHWYETSVCRRAWLSLEWGRDALRENWGVLTDFLRLDATRAWAGY